MANHFNELLEQELRLLRVISEELAAIARPKPGAWTRKQELGHLVDSAANNHIRFVRATLEGGYQGPSYLPDAWVDLHDYQTMPWTEIVDLWYHFNRLLLRVTRQLPEAVLNVECRIGQQPAVTLGFVIDDYVLHMRHHTDHILDRDPVTPYPAR